MEELAKIEAKGDASQEELEALAQDLSSKVRIETHIWIEGIPRRVFHPLPLVLQDHTQHMC